MDKETYFVGMDAAYGAKEIHEKSESLGHVPVIGDNSPRCDKDLKALLSSTFSVNRLGCYQPKRQLGWDSHPLG